MQSVSFASNKIDSERKAEYENYISIKGSSNVNEFELINISPSISEAPETVTNSGTFRKIQIAVDDFTGPNDRMVQDFKEMVDAGNYPLITIFIEQKELADFDETTGLTNFKTKISIAGVAQKYTVPCSVESKLDGGYLLDGSFSLKLTDFKIDPPQKLMGLVQVKDKVFINFVFNFDTEEILTEKM
jgi:hypothetical protein